MLYLIATPIGNLKDITFRAVEVLKSCDYLLCEDTRHSLSLLNHYQIHKPLVSYHKFNEEQRIIQILEDLKSNKQIGLISDAGMPAISDPGERLIQRCVEENLPFCVLPGPCALLQGLVVSGFPTSHFQFCGFLPKLLGELKKKLALLFNYAGTTVCYESPHRLKKTLEVMKEIDPNKKIAFARELTKKFEEVKRGTVKELLAELENSTLKGEIVLIISPSEFVLEAVCSPQEHVKELQQSYGLSLAEAIKTAAELRGVSKREIYQIVHGLT